MNAATALVTGLDAGPALAEAAVRSALAKADLQEVGGILLFLSSDFARQPQPAVIAAARAAGCMQVFGLVASGLCTEEGWSLDQPAAAALVLGNGLTLATAQDADAEHLCFTSGTNLPAEWREAGPRHGLLVSAAPVWQQGRIMANRRAEASVRGARCCAALSTGLHLLAEPMSVEAARAYDIELVGGQRAADSLLRSLPAELRSRDPLPLHLLCAVRAEGGPGIPVLGANANGSLTLADNLAVGDRIAWAVRQPLTAERDMATSLESAAASCPTPDFALMLSCIGRGPLFYGGDDRDLNTFRRRFPGVPLLGAYGTGQIHPFAGDNRQFQNSVVTLLFQSDHV